jgi:hypothetical protein
MEKSNFIFDQKKKKKNPNCIYRLILVKITSRRKEHVK